MLAESIGFIVVVMVVGTLVGSVFFIIAEKAEDVFDTTSYSVDPSTDSENVRKQPPIGMKQESLIDASVVMQGMAGVGIASEYYRDLK